MVSARMLNPGSALSIRPTKPSRTNTPQIYPFIIGDWNAKVRSQEIPGVTGKVGLGV